MSTPNQTVRCPHCERALEYPEHLGGSEVQCPICEQRLSLPPHSCTPPEAQTARPNGLGVKVVVGLIAGICLWFLFANMFGIDKKVAESEVKSLMAREAKEAREQQDIQDKAFKVKGFYIGMRTNALRAAIDTNFDKTWSLGHAVDQPDWLMLTKFGESSQMLKQEKQVSFKYDYRDEVVSIYFNRYATAAAFGAANMGANEFVKTFIEAYGIPAMDGDNGFWVYNGRGVKVRITTEKEVLIEKYDPASVSRKFN